MEYIRTYTYVCYNNYFGLLVPAEVIDNVPDFLENGTNPVTFSCQATGEPVPNITWYFNSIMINTSNTSKYNKSSSINGNAITSVFIIMDIKLSDVGNYTCYAENMFGVDRDVGVLVVNGKQKYFIISIFKYIFIEIIEPIGGETANIEEGNNVTFRCIGVGYPPPLVQWSKLNGSLSDRVSITNMSLSTNEGNVTNVTVDLIFTGAYREDTGVYECSVSNLFNFTRNISLIVQCMYIYVTQCKLAMYS